jgi:hypothetical protein
VMKKVGREIAGEDPAASHVSKTARRRAPGGTVVSAIFPS